MKLVKNWRHAWRWVSIQCMVVAGAINAAWLHLPPELKNTIPEAWLLWLTVSLAVLGSVGRLVDQSR